MVQQHSPRLSDSLLDWYDQHQRIFPWRARQGETPDPYRVWLSEIMLQQTGTATVIAYFNKFVARWPSVQALANAHLDEVLTQWAGLGYYARARNLHRCAQIISTEMNGKFPSDLTLLQTLPGIGPYTAAAIAAIAFDAAAPVLDGNIERVLSRLYAMTAPLPGAKPKLRELSLGLLDCVRPGDMAQAMMDLAQPFARRARRIAQTARGEKSARRMRGELPERCLSNRASGRPRPMLGRCSG